MRDAMGSAWVISLCLTFTIIFTGFMAISVNYARAFQIKSGIVSRIEENEGYDPSIEQNIEAYMVNRGYTAYGSCNSEYNVPGSDTDWSLVATIDLGNAPVGSDEHNACIYRTVSLVDDTNTPMGSEKSQYRVVVFFKFDLPVIKYHANLQVSGESRYIYDFAYSDGGIIVA